MGISSSKLALGPEMELATCFCEYKAIDKFYVNEKDCMAKCRNASCNSGFWQLALNEEEWVKIAHERGLRKHDEPRVHHFNLEF